MNEIDIKSRAIKMLSADRGLLPEENKRLICNDVKCVLDEFFQLNSGIKIELEELKVGYELKISTTIDRVKSFTVIKQKTGA